MSNFGFQRKLTNQSEMKKVIYLLAFIPVILFASCDQNEVKDFTPEEFAKVKLQEAMLCKSETELEAVILNFEQFISILTESGDQGKMVAKNILQQENITTQFYDDFVVDSYNYLKTIPAGKADDYQFKVDDTKTEMGLTRHKLVATDKSGIAIQLEIIEANGIFYLGQIRQKK
ncbi:MAG: hypothetical protein ACI9QR_002373 [Flavobacteriaceae bacterium]|jgi:hypothetical protein